MNNPISMIKNFMNNSVSPREIAMQMISNTNNPVFINLVQMARNGDYQGVENFARNYMKEQGKDLDEEMAKFKKLLNENK